MRIASGVTDQILHFVAVDATDKTTRETGLTTFTVYRTRNGGAAAAMTTPTVTEVDATNMPGLYTLLLDEDMTIGAGNLTEEISYHITQAAMAPVTRTIELFNPNNYTVGTVTTLTNLPAITTNWLTATGIAASALDGKGNWNIGKTGYSLTQTFPANFSDFSIEVTTGKVFVKLTDTCTANTDMRGNDATPLDAAGIRAAVGLASANTDTQFAASATATGFATEAKQDAQKTVIDNLNSGIIYSSAATGTLTTTEATTALTGYADTQLVGRVMIVLSGNAAGEATDITSYANTGGKLTFTALTVAMANGDTFKII